MNKYLEFRWWKLAVVLVLDFLLGYLTVIAQPYCACPPGLQCGPCTSGLQLFLALLIFVITIYLIVTIIYTIIKRFNK